MNPSYKYNWYNLLIFHVKQKNTHILNNMDTFYSSSQYDENGKQCKVYSYKKNDTFIVNK